ncbi:MAG TPA: redoxin family protein [Ktedonobacterales bacterium]|jgi:thiol-disulfide isomerase/thioredoxin|nr:redoxin family protein [Ktedonobacterales bacterium]
MSDEKAEPINYRLHGLVDPASITLARAELGSLAAAETFADGVFGGPMPSLEGATAWLNTPALTLPGLRGQVVLVNFWTYTCINWLRTLPYVRAWAEKYRDQGLVVIGAHTPEFGFEHNLENVRRAVAELRVAYAVAVDSDYAIWEAFNNHYWPALYFVDAHGRIRQQQFGEGEYEAAEQTIQQLLTEAGATHVSQDFVAPEARGVEVAAEWGQVGSGETYVGYARAESFASPEGLNPGARQLYTAPADLRRNAWAFAGEWTVEDQPATANTPNARLAFRFHARDLHLVMGPAARNAPVPFRVTLDGAAPGEAHGGDVDAQGNGTLHEQRLYQLIRQSGHITDRRFEIAFPEAGAQAFAFTFG